jgi:hypothetical protein
MALCARSENRFPMTKFIMVYHRDDFLRELMGPRMMGDFRENAQQMMGLHTLSRSSAQACHLFYTSTARW